MIENLSIWSMMQSLRSGEDVTVAHNLLIILKRRDGCNASAGSQVLLMSSIKGMHIIVKIVT